MIFLRSKFSGVGSDEGSVLSSLSFILISAVPAASAKVVGVFKEIIICFNLHYIGVEAGGQELQNKLDIIN